MTCRSRPSARCGAWRIAYVLILLPFASSAQQAPADLASALREAWSRHPAAVATDASIAAARARADALARPLYNPELELAVDDEGDERTATAGVALTLDLSGKRGARADLGKAELTLVEAEALLRRSTFAQRWLQAWAERAAATERVRVSEQRVALVTRFAELAGRQLAVGDIAPLERDLALLARDEAAAEHASIVAEAAIADETLLALGGVSVLPPAPAEAPPPPTAEGVAYDRTPEALIASATSVRAARHVDVAQRNRRVDPTVSVRGGRIDLGPFSDDVLGLTVTVPLFVRNPYRAEVVAARADLSAAEAEMERVALELEARAVRAVRSYEAVRTAWVAWAQSPGTDVERHADLLERLWQAGELSTADYLVQLKQVLDTALAGAELRGRLWRHYVDALQATGRLDAWLGFDRMTSETIP